MMPEQHIAWKLKAGASKLTLTDWTSYWAISMVTVCTILLLPFIRTPFEIDSVISFECHCNGHFTRFDAIFRPKPSTSFVKCYVQKIFVSINDWIRSHCDHSTSIHVHKPFRYDMISTLSTAHLNSNLVHLYLSTNIFDKWYKNEQNANSVSCAEINGEYRFDKQKMNGGWLLWRFE